jgi:hypothetical protein
MAALFPKSKRLATPILLSVLLHAAAALLAGWVIITRYRSQPVFEASIVSTQNSAEAGPGTAPPSPSTTATHSAVLRQQAHAIRSSVSSGWKTPPLSSLTPTANRNAPDLQNFLQGSGISTSSQSLAGIVSSLSLGAGGSPQPPLPSPQFLGRPVTGEKILLLFDVSRTVANAAAHKGIPMERIREETAHLIDHLGIHTRFGLVQFARNYAFFRTELAAATQSNREAAKNWLNLYFSTDGTLARGIPRTVTGSPGFLVALEHAFQLDPDTLFILSDGSFQRGSGIRANIPWEEFEATLDRLQKQRALPAKLHFIGVATKPENTLALQRILLKYGGSFSELGR